MDAVLDELVRVSDDVFARTRGRVEGLTDDEYHWEPAPGCWGVHRDAGGHWVADPAVPVADPPPLTTIAWRLWHLIDMYGEDRTPTNFGVEPVGEAVGLDAPDPTPPATAAEALTMLDRAHARWRAHLTALTDDALGQRMGPAAGGRAESTRLAFALHMLDEHIHHGAEVATLRDQWRWSGRLDPEPVLERIMRGDVSVLDDIAAPDIERLGEALVARAGVYGRWELVDRLLDRGAPPGSGGLTALHIAAGAGNVALVERLLVAGADTDARDPQFDATPRRWADFFGQSRVMAVLDEAAAGDRPAGG